MKYLALTASLLAVTAHAADWVQVGGSYTKSRGDGTTWSYRAEYDPSSVVRDGAVVSFTFETVDTGGVRVFFDRLNCASRQYQIAVPGGEFSEPRDITPGTLGTDFVALFCRPS